MPAQPSPAQSTPAGGPLAGEPRERRLPGHPSAPARAGAWLIWWILAVSLWIALDYSVGPAELLAGAGAAAIAALLAELATYQAAARFRLRPRWLVQALWLPGAVAADMVTVYAALWRRLVRGEQPRSAFVAKPVRPGGGSALDVTRRVLLIGARSLAPNAFALGIDRDAGTIVMHELVSSGDGGE